MRYIVQYVADDSQATNYHFICDTFEEAQAFIIDFFDGDVETAEQSQEEEPYLGAEATWWDNGRIFSIFEEKKTLTFLDRFTKIDYLYVWKK